VALIANENLAADDIEQADAIAVPRGAVSDPEVLAAAIERAIERHVPETPVPSPEEIAAPMSVTG